MIFTIKSVGVSQAVSISRRDWLEELADTFRDANTHILYRSGKPYRLPDIDEAFGDDPDMRWLSDFLKPDASGRRPARRSKKLERLRLFDLYFRVKHPRIASHFGR